MNEIYDAFERGKPISWLGVVNLKYTLYEVMMERWPSFSRVWRCFPWCGGVTFEKDG